MDFFELQDWYKEMYPEKKITYELDSGCHRIIEVVLTDSIPNVMHHVECRKVKVTVEGEKPKYIPISPHRMNVAWSEVRKFILSKKDVHIHPDEIENLRATKKESSKAYEEKMLQLAEWTGLEIHQIEQKM